MRRNRDSMSKFDALWIYVAEVNEDRLFLVFDDVERIAGVPIDHSFLTYKKELLAYGFCVGKISMKAKTVEFLKVYDS